MCNATRPDLAAFEGQWQLARTIYDARAGQQAQVTGSARFAPGQGGLIYDEDSTLQIPGQPPLRATRRYLWQPVGDQIAVLFDDGRAFHMIGPGTTPQAHHDCPPDTYDVAYEFSQWPAWQARWRVTGPRKDYISQTTYRRG